MPIPSKRKAADIESSDPHAGVAMSLLPHQPRTSSPLRFGRAISDPQSPIADEEPEEPEEDVWDRIKELDVNFLRRVVASVYSTHPEVRPLVDEEVERRREAGSDSGTESDGGGDDEDEDEYEDDEGATGKGDGENEVEGSGGGHAEGARGEEKSGPARDILGERINQIWELEETSFEEVMSTVKVAAETLLQDRITHLEKYQLSPEDSPVGTSSWKPGAYDGKARILKGGIKILEGIVNLSDEELITKACEQQDVERIATIMRDVTLDMSEAEREAFEIAESIDEALRPMEGWLTLPQLKAVGDLFQDKT